MVNIGQNVGNQMANVIKSKLEKFAHFGKHFVKKTSHICETTKFEGIQTCVNLVDVEYCRKLSTSILKLQKIGFDTAENESFNFHNSSSL